MPGMFGYDQMDEEYGYKSERKESLKDRGEKMKLEDFIKLAKKFRSTPIVDDDFESIRNEFDRGLEILEQGLLTNSGLPKPKDKIVEGRDPSHYLAQSLANLSQSIIVLRLFKEAGFNTIRIQNNGECQYQTSFDYIEEEIHRVSK